VFSHDIKEILFIIHQQENHEYLVRIFARNEVGLSDPLESEEPFKVLRPTGESINWRPLKEIQG